MAADRIAQARADAQALHDYWSWAMTCLGGCADGDEFGPKFVAAQEAMTRLVQWSSIDLDVRAVFAGASIFETALLTEPVTNTSFFYETLSSPHAATAVDDGAMRVDFKPEDQPPRLIMVNEIFDTATGAGWFSAPPDPAGLTTWLHSADVAVTAIARAINGDVLVAVRAALLGILAQATIPVQLELQTIPLPGARPNPSPVAIAVQHLADQIPSSPWPQNLRAGLAAQCQAVLTRFQTDAAVAASGGLMSLTLPDGTSTQVVSAPPRPWFREGRVIVAGVFGLLGGALLAGRWRKRRS